MSLDIHGRHKEVCKSCPLPNVLVSIVLAHLGNELVIAKRTPRTRMNYIINIIDDDIYWQTNDCLYINDTNTELNLPDIGSVSKLSNTRLLIQYNSVNNVIYDIETKESYSIPGCIAVAFKGNVYYRTSQNHMYKVSPTDNTVVFSADVSDIDVQAGCMMVYRLRSYKTICASDEKWYAAGDEAYSVHIYNGKLYYVHRNMLFSFGFQYDLDGVVLFAQQCGHCVYVATMTSGYVWDLRHQKVYLLNERIHAQEAGEQRFARVSDEWIDHFF